MTALAITAETRKSTKAILILFTVDASNYVG